MPPTSRARSARHSPLTRPRKPWLTPYIVQPKSIPDRTTERIAAFIPGESPPLVKTATLRMPVPLMLNELKFHRHGIIGTWAWFSLWPAIAAAKFPSTQLAQSVYNESSAKYRRLVGNLAQPQRGGPTPQPRVKRIGVQRKSAQPWVNVERFSENPTGVAPRLPASATPSGLDSWRFEFPGLRGVRTLTPLHLGLISSHPFGV